MKRFDDDDIRAHLQVYLKEVLCSRWNNVVTTSSIHVTDLSSHPFSHFIYKNYTHIQKGKPPSISFTEWATSLLRIEVYNCPYLMDLSSAVHYFIISQYFDTSELPQPPSWKVDNRITGCHARLMRISHPTYYVSHILYRSITSLLLGIHMICIQINTRHIYTYFLLETWLPHMAFLIFGRFFQLKSF